MSETHVTGETHGCIVCGKLYQLYVVYNENGEFVDCKVMSMGGKCVPHSHHAMVACETHNDEQIEVALVRWDVMRKEDD